MQNTYRNLILEQDEEKQYWKYVKAADKLSALIKCEEELAMGNVDFAQAGKSTLEAVKNLHLEEADYFLEHFLPAYRLTLDDQAEDV